MEMYQLLRWNRNNPKWVILNNYKTSSRALRDVDNINLFVENNKKYSAKNYDGRTWWCMIGHNVLKRKYYELDMDGKVVNIYIIRAFSVI